MMLDTGPWMLAEDPALGDLKKVSFSLIQHLASSSQYLVA